MIIISSVAVDPEAVVAIDTEMDIRENIARVARIKTLDGGVVINNSGFSYGDITVTISEEITEAQAETIWYIFKNYVAINLATPAGFFLAAIKKVKTDNGALNMTILIDSKLA